MIEKEKSEDTILLFAFTPSDHFIDVELLLDYIGNFFVRKSQIDSSDRFNVITFNKKGPVYFEDFTHYGEELFEKVKEIVRCNESVNLSEGISVALNLFIEVFKTITGKVFRLIIITDKSTPKLEITDYLKDLTNQVASFPMAIDILRIATYDREEEKILSYFIKPTGGTMYYYDNEDDAGNILFDLAQKKKWDKSNYTNNGEFNLTDDNRGLIDFLAADIERLPPSSESFDTIKCQICGKGKNLYECPQCGITFHANCLAHWAQYSNMGKLLPNVLRCPTCFRILRLDAKFVRDVQSGAILDEDTLAYLHNAMVLEEYNQKELLKESDIGVPNLVSKEEVACNLEITHDNMNKINKDIKLEDVFEEIEDIQVILCPYCGKMITNEFSECIYCGKNIN